MSCSTNSNKHCNVYSTNLSIENFSNTHLLNDGSHYYLFGEYDRMENGAVDARRSQISIVKSKVGDATNWVKFTERIAGKCSAVFETDDHIFLISEENNDKGGNPKYSKQVLSKIEKISGKVRRLYEWDLGSSYVRSIYFDSDEIGFVFFRPSGNPLDYQLLKTETGGKQWSHIDLKTPVNRTHNKSNKLHFLSYKRNDKKEWIFSIDKQGKNLDSLQFRLDITDFSVAENDEYWLLGKDGDQTVLQHYENKKATNVHTFLNNPLFSPKQLYTYNELIVVIGSQIDENMLGGFGGTKPIMFVSNDKGLTWNNHDLGKILYMNPISFYKDQEMTAYIGEGKILTCKFKK